MAVRELGVRLPVARGPLIAVIELDVTEETAVEVRRAEVHVREHVGLGDGAGQLVAGAPTGGRGELFEPLPVDGGRRSREGAEGGEAVAVGQIGQATVFGDALGTHR